MSRAEKIFKDRDYLLTVENLFFCVVGYTHPPDKVVSYLKYAPIKEEKNKVAYKRILKYYTISCLKDSLNYLEKNHPVYVCYDKISGLKFSSVPILNIKKHFCPEKKVEELLSKNRKDELELKAAKIVLSLADESGVSLKYFGITGSILIGLHHPKFSDVDITVYGKNNSLKLKETMLGLYKSKTSIFKKFSGECLKNWCNDKAKLYPLTFTEAENLYKRIWNRGVYGETMFSIHPIRLDEEIYEKYGEKIFSQNGLVEAEATIKNADEAIFMPSTYLVEDVKIRFGLNVEVESIISYEGLYGGIFEEGEKILVKGVLEKVEDLKRGKSSWRIVVGSLKADGKDYIKPKTF